MKIDLIHIQGYKSIANIKIEDVCSFATFAGANGAGKSNFVDALAFFGVVVKYGAVRAIKEFGGFDHIHCYKLPKKQATTAKFEIKVLWNNQLYHYALEVHHMNSEPTLVEHLSINGKKSLERKTGEGLSINFEQEKGQLSAVPGSFPDGMSALMLRSNSEIYEFMTNIRVFRFDPLGAKEPDSSNTDSSELDMHGRNIATMLSIIEKDKPNREQIIEWIEMIVPSMEKIKTEQQGLGGKTSIKFKEYGTKSYFPANLISDGTIYALCILTAILSQTKPFGLTIIEEPERGIHPKAIAELVGLIREYSSNAQPFFITTHNESVVRSAKIEELWLISKEEGKTQIKNAKVSSVDLDTMPLDKAWLMNMFSGGLPW